MQLASPETGGFKGYSRKPIFPSSLTTHKTTLFSWLKDLECREPCMKQHIGLHYLNISFILNCKTSYEKGNIACI